MQLGGSPAEMKVPCGGLEDAELPEGRALQ